MKTILKNILPLSIASIFLFMIGCADTPKDSKDFKTSDMGVKINISRSVAHGFDDTGLQVNKNVVRIAFSLYEAATGYPILVSDDSVVVTIGGQEFTTDLHNEVILVDSSPFENEIQVDFINNEQLDIAIQYNRENYASTTVNVSLPPIMYMTQGIVYRENFLWESEELYFEWMNPAISDTFAMVDYDINRYFTAECLVKELPTFDKTMTSITIPAGTFTVSDNTNCVSGFVSSEPAYFYLIGHWDFEPQIQSEFGEVLITQLRGMKVDIGKIKIP
ncbi:MAG: hypothetical protein OEY19_10350 [Gammaproteobacteria bacterium]|nr:hypothetical protein [Gammaproteobacteria bacterium]MDH5629197.1 hypothetical protein [Gammaproteobacteria bacterium]